MARSENSDLRRLNSDLKRLNFVASSTAKAFDIAVPTAEKAYQRAKSFVPAIVQPEFARVEEGVSNTVAPLAAKASDACDKLLHYADGKVDSIMTAAERGTDACFEIHEANLKSFRSAAQSFMNFILRTGEYVLSMAPKPVRDAVQAALNLLYIAIAKAQEATDPDVAVQMASDAWDKFASYPTVAKLLKTADPYTQRALSTFYSLHDYLVKAPIYKGAVDTGAATLSFATSFTVYKLSVRIFYPFVRPIADPAYAKVSNSRVFNSLVDYWRPTVAVKSRVESKEQ